MLQFVFMLTQNDATVDDALATYQRVRESGLRYVGFKDVGASTDELRRITDVAHADGLEVMLEVVSLALEDELRSIEAAVEIDVDWVLGGTHPAEGARALAGSGKRYCPFAGRVAGHPSVLHGTIVEIAESARTTAAFDGVHGLDLLAYRHPTVDAPALVREVVQASAALVIVAGSIASIQQIRTLEATGAWGFTIGGAIFEGHLPGAPDVDRQVREVLSSLQEAGQPDP